MQVTYRVPKRWWQSKTILGGVWTAFVGLFQIWVVWVPVPAPSDAPPGTLPPAAVQTEPDKRLTIGAPNEARVSATLTILSGLGVVIWGRATVKQPIGK